MVTQFDTKGGNVSPEDTFLHLIEHLRLIQEDAQTLGSRRKLAHDDSAALQWFAIAKNFDKIIRVVSKLGTEKTKDSVGYRHAN